MLIVGIWAFRARTVSGQQAVADKKKELKKAAAVSSISSWACNAREEGAKPQHQQPCTGTGVQDRLWHLLWASPGPKKLTLCEGMLGCLTQLNIWCKHAQMEAGSLFQLAESYLHALGYVASTPSCMHCWSDMCPPGELLRNCLQVNKKSWEKSREEQRHPIKMEVRSARWDIPNKWPAGMYPLNHTTFCITLGEQSPNK